MFRNLELTKRVRIEIRTREEIRSQNLEIVVIYLFGMLGIFILYIITLFIYLLS